LFVHPLLDGIFVVGFSGVLECAAEAGRSHVCACGAVGYTSVRYGKGDMV
jgi:hypothetical protein